MIPGSITPLLLNSAAAGGLQIERSLRFNSSDSAYLSRTPGTASNRKTWTWSGWVKRSVLGSAQGVFEAGTGSGTDIWAGLIFNSSNQIFCGFANNASNDTYIQSTAVFRDCSAWYHIVLAVDTTNATNTDRVKLYVNNERITVFSDSAYGAQNTDSIMNTTNLFVIGQRRNSSTAYFNGYLTNIHFIDGQALDPSSFTETDATTGQLIPKTYTGSYGTNGFNLLFADNSSNTASTLGKDTSGLSNNWTPNNLSVTAGAGNDSLVDSPTNYGTDTGVGGTVRGNYCTFNPIDKGSSIGLSNGNLQFTESGGGPDCGRATFAIPSSGKWYWETLLGAVGSGCNIGIATGSTALTAGGALTGVLYQFSGYVAINGWGSSGAYGGAYTTNDLIGIAVDMDTGTITFYKNGTSLGAAYSSLSAAIQYFPFFQGTTVTWIANFGQRAFAYTAPSGFKALCTQNLPAPLVTKSNEVFDVALWTGTGVGGRAVTGLNFNPDLVWLKRRSSGGASSNQLHDVVRTASAGALYSDLTNAEDSNYPITSFDAAGFTLGSSASLASQSYASQNETSQTYVGWAWDGGTSTVSNTQGSITSQVRANATAGFSVMTYTGQTAAGTIGHGLGVAPSLIITKARSNAQSWGVYHKDVGINNYLLLDSTGASTSYSGIWGSSAPTSTVFGVPGNVGLNNNNTWTYVAYCFAPVVGYSSFGSYVGNGSSDGPMVYTGFRPRWVLVKLSSSAGNPWLVFDSARSTYNVVGNKLAPNSSVAEDDASIGNSTQNTVDFLSNGFKPRTADNGTNGSALTYIYAAFAEAPFNYSRAR